MKFENFPQQKESKSADQTSGNLEAEGQLTPEQIQETVAQTIEFQKEEIQELFENAQENENPENQLEAKKRENPSTSRMKKALCILTASAMFFAFSPKQADAEQEKKSIPQKQTEQLGKDVKNIGKRTANNTKKAIERNVQKVINDSIKKGLDSIFGKRR